MLVSAASICITSLAFALFPARLDAHVDCEMGASACRGEIAMLTDASRTLVAMPSFLFAYSSQVTVQPFGTLAPHSHTRSHIALSAIPPSCFPQANIPALRAELDRPTRSRMLMVILGARFGAESRTTGWPVPRPCHSLQSLPLSRTTLMTPYHVSPHAVLFPPPSTARSPVRRMPHLVTSSTQICCCPTRRRLHLFLHAWRPPQSALSVIRYCHIRCLPALDRCYTRAFLADVVCR